MICICVCVFIIIYYTARRNVEFCARRYLQARRRRGRRDFSARALLYEKLQTIRIG